MVGKYPVIILCGSKRQLSFRGSLNAPQFMIDVLVFDFWVDRDNILGHQQLFQF